MKHGDKLDNEFYTCCFSGCYTNANLRTCCESGNTFDKLTDPYDIGWMSALAEADSYFGLNVNSSAVNPYNIETDEYKQFNDGYLVYPRGLKIGSY